MKKLSVSIILDTIFFSFVALTTCFVVFCYFLPVKSSIIISIILSVIIGILTFISLKHKRAKTLLSKADKLKREKLINQLCFYPKKMQILEFYKVLTRLNLSVQTSNDHLLVGGSEKVHTLFTFNELTKQDIVEILNTDLGGEYVTIYCRSFNDEVKKFCDRLKVSIHGESDVYKLFLTANYYPEIKVDLTDERLKIKDFLSGIFLKRRARGFFTTGLTLLFLSFFTPFKLYYIIFGCVLAVFSVFCKFYGKENPKNS